MTRTLGARLLWLRGPVECKRESGLCLRRLGHVRSSRRNAASSSTLVNAARSSRACRMRSSRPARPTARSRPLGMLPPSSACPRGASFGWRKRWDPNPRTGCPVASFQDWSVQPLGHAALPFGVLVLTIRLWALVGLQTYTG